MGELKGAAKPDSKQVEQAFSVRRHRLFQRCVGSVANERCTRADIDRYKLPEVLHLVRFLELLAVDPLSRFGDRFGAAHLEHTIVRDAHSASRDLSSKL
jgi:hypothetical protein